MPRVVITRRGVLGIERCRDFLRSKSPLAASRAAAAIRRQLGLLRVHPEIGRPHPELPDCRELLIPFGDSGYVALYRYVAADDSVLVLAFRHQKEAGYWSG